MQNRILLPVDDSMPSREAAVALARFIKDRGDTQLLLFHCSQPLARIYQEELFHTTDAAARVSKAQDKKGQEVLEGVRQAVVKAGFPGDRIQTQLKVDSQDPAQDILSEAEKQKITTIAIGRRGRSKVESLLLGSVSAKVTQYARRKTVWVIDPDVTWSQKVLIGLEDHPECLSLVRYAGDQLAAIPDLKYSLLHLMPPQPPTFWDDGHILTAEEQKQRDVQRDKWRAGWVERVEKLLGEGRDILVSKGVPAANVETRIDIISQGIAQDLLNNIEANSYQMVVIGKKSFRQSKPFNLGSHANKILYSVKRTMLSVVDSPAAQ